MEITDVRNVLVIYHREDNDGVCSAAIISQFIKNFGNPAANIKFFGCNYAELSTIWNDHQAFVVQQAQHKMNPPQKISMTKDKLNSWVTNYDMIFMVDISFNEADAMEYLYDSMPANNFVWCDHHLPIIEFSNRYATIYKFGKTPGIRRTDQSALLNTWDYMAEVSNTDIQPSRVLVMLSDYDSWAWTRKDEYVGDNKDKLFAINTGFTRRSNLKVKWFENYINTILIDNLAYRHAIEVACLEYGTIILKYDNERTTRTIKSHGDTSWTLGGEKACAIFTTDRFNSQSFTNVFAGTDIEHGIVFKREPDGRWVLGAYNVSEDTDFDCGAYLKANYSGGGHKGAAGCTITQNQFIEMLTSHQV